MNYNPTLKPWLWIKYIIGIFLPLRNAINKPAVKIGVNDVEKYAKNIIFELWVLFEVPPNITDGFATKITPNIADIKHIICVKEIFSFKKQ